MILCFVIAFSSLVGAVSLKYLIREAHEEMHMLEERFKKLKA